MIGPLLTLAVWAVLIAVAFGIKRGFTFPEDEPPEADRADAR